MELAPGLPCSTNSSVREIALGSRYEDQWGRVFHYAKAGGTGLSRGKLVVAADPVANHLNMSFAVAPAVGDKSVTVTLGATAATANQYRDGWLAVQDGTGEGRMYRIEGHQAADASASLVIWLCEPIDTAGALAEANVDLVYNKYDSVVISATDQADIPVGVPVGAITASYYGWVQTWGPCAVLMDEAIAAGDTVTIGTGVAGAVEAVDAVGEPVVGHMSELTGVDTEYTTMYLQIDK